MSGKTGLSLTASGCMDSHRSTSSSKRSLNHSELLAGITNLEPKSSSFSRAKEKLKEFNTPKAPSIRYSDIRGCSWSPTGCAAPDGS